MVTEFHFVQADFLRNGTTKKVMNLSKRDQSQLWQSLALGKEGKGCSSVLEKTLIV